MRTALGHAITAAVAVALVLLADRDPALGILGLIASIGALALVCLGPEKLGTALMVLALFLAPQDALRPPGGGVVTLGDVCLVLGIALLVPTMARNRARAPFLFVVGAIGLVLTSSLTSALAAAGIVSLEVALRMLLASVALPAAFLAWHPTLRTTDWLIWAYVLGQIASTAFGLIDGALVNGRHQGNSTHPNFFAFGGLLATVALLHLWHRVPPRNHWMIWACGAVTAYSVSMSGSRGALLALALVIAIYPLIERSVMSAYVLIAATLAAVPALGWLIDTFATDNSALGRLFGDSSTAYSDDTRSTALEQGWDRFMSSPIIGTGYDQLLATHNIFLQVAIAVGILGLGAWLVMIVPFVSPLLGTHPLRRLGYVTLAYLAMGMTEPSLWERLVWCPLAVALLAAVPLRADDPEAPAASEAPPTTARPRGRGSASPANVAAPGPVR